MDILITTVHVVACVVLILIVLLQTGKGADMGVAFGAGSSQTLFGTSGATSFLGKVTGVIAVVFLVTSLTLAYLHSVSPNKSMILDSAKKSQLEQKVDDKKTK